MRRVKNSGERDDQMNLDERDVFAILPDRHELAAELSSATVEFTRALFSLNLVGKALLKALDGSDPEAQLAAALEFTKAVTQLPAANAALLTVVTRVGAMVRLAGRAASSN